MRGGVTLDAYMTDLLYVKPFTNKFPDILSHLLFRHPREIFDALLDPNTTWQGFIEGSSDGLLR